MVVKEKGLSEKGERRMRTFDAIWAVVLVILRKRT